MHCVCALRAAAIERPWAPPSAERRRRAPRRRRRSTKKTNARNRIADQAFDDLERDVAATGQREKRGVLAWESAFVAMHASTPR